MPRFDFRVSFLKEFGFAKKPSMIGFSVNQRDECKQAIKKGDVRRLISKLVNIFMCHGGGRWLNRCFSTVMAVLSPGHWACLVPGQPSTSWLRLGAPVGKKKPRWRPHKCPACSVALRLYLGVRPPPSSDGEVQLGLIGRAQPVLYFVSSAVQPQAEVGLGSPSIGFQLQHGN